MKTLLASLFLAGLMTSSRVLAQDATPTAEPPPGNSASTTVFGGAAGARGRGPGATNPPSGGAARGIPTTKLLDENVMIHIKGVIAKDTPVDITFTGCGPSFNLSKVMGVVPVNGNNQPVIGTCDIIITPVEGAYRVQYSLGCRLPTVSSSTVSLSSSRGRTVSTTTSAGTSGSTGDASVSAATTGESAGTTGGGTSSTSTSPRPQNNVTSTVTYTAVSTSSSVILKMGQTITASSSGDQDLTISLTKPTP